MDRYTVQAALEEATDAQGVSEDIRQFTDQALLGEMLRRRRLHLAGRTSKVNEQQLLDHWRDLLEGVTEPSSLQGTVP